MSHPAGLDSELAHLYQRPLCLVTGGTSGIGLATAKLFASKGFNIYTCGRSNERLERAKIEILDAADGPAVCRTGQHDLTGPGAAMAVADEAIEAFGKVDVLVNNAAMAPLAAIDTMDDQQIENTINLNIRSVYRLTQSVWPKMKEQGSGVIVNLSSLASIDPFTGFSMYGATKAWIDTFTLALAGEGSEFGIRCYSIRPGAVETPMLRSLFPDFPADQTVSPETVAEKIWECSSDPDHHVSGHAFTVTNQPMDS